VSFDGIDVRELSVSELRQRVVLLSQEPVDYSATVAESIMYGDLNTRDNERMRAAAEAVGLDATVEKLPHGFDTLLGSWFTDGHELSVGEWQRVGLARALYRNADVTILDEPTSSMDPWTERLFLKNLKEFARGKTVILITHRVSTAKAADTIFIMQHGKVVEESPSVDFDLWESKRL